MSDLNLGRKRNSNSGSQNSTLKSVKQKIDLQQFKGTKIDNNAINQILHTIIDSQKNSGQYNLDLTSANNDALIEKIKDVIQKLYDQQQKDLTTSDSSTNSTLSIQDIEKVVKQELQKLIFYTDSKEQDDEEDINQIPVTINTTSLENKLKEIHDIIGTEQNEESEYPIKEGKIGEFTNTGIAADFNQLQKDISVKLLILTKIDNLVETISKHQSKITKYINDRFSGSWLNITTLSKSTLKHILAPIQNLGLKLTNISKNILTNLSKPFKIIKNGIKIFSLKLKSGLVKIKQVTTTALKSAMSMTFKAFSSIASILNPFKLFKKKKKKPTKLEIKLSKMIDKVNNFIDNFFTLLLSQVDKFLDKALKSAKKIVDKLMTHVMEWLLLNVVVLGVIFALIIKLIAEPLKKLLEPIFQFIGNIINKLVVFLTPVRDFLLKVFAEAWNIIKTPLSGLMKGIGAVAESLGRALGKLIIGIANFTVDTLMPFIKDHILPVFKVVLDILKEFFVAIKPWIKPIVDTVLSVLKKFLEAIKPWIEPLVNVVLKTLIQIMDIIRRLVVEVGEILIDIAKIIHTPIKIIKDFFEGLGSHAKEIGEKVGSIVLKVLTAIDENLNDLIDIVRMNVVAPLSGLRRFIDANLIIPLKNSLWVPTFEWGDTSGCDGIFGGIKALIRGITGMQFFKNYLFLKQKIPFSSSQTPTLIENPDEGKGVLELIADEQSKIAKKISAEKEAKEAAAIAQRLQKQKIDELLKNQNVISDILAYSKSSHEQLNSIATNLGLEQIEIETPTLTDEATSIQQQSIEQTKNELDFRTTLMDYLNSLSQTMSTNFNLILEKLDEQPNLVPIPLMNPTEGNLTIMEDM